MAAIRFIMAVLLAAFVGWLGMGMWRTSSLFGPQVIEAPSPFNNEGLPIEARSEVGGSVLHRADAVRGVIDTRDPSIHVRS